MAGKAKRKHLDPASALKSAEQCALFLMDVLKHPTVDKRGSMGFNARLVPIHPPVSREAGCLTGVGVLTLPDLVGVVGNLRRLIQEARSPAARRGAKA